jgi:hypothetical protein
MKKVIFIFGVFSFFSLKVFSQNIIKDSLEINKAWWGRMVQKYPGFHGTNNRWMSTGDFNKDGLPDIVLQFAAVGSGNNGMFWQDSLENSKRFKGVFINKGNQYFILDTNLVYFFKGGDDGHIVLDLNGDGNLDVYQPTDNWHGARNKTPIWYKDSTNMGEYVFINNSNNSFAGSFVNDTTLNSPFSTSGSTRHYQIIDIDNDKNDEIVFEGLYDELPKVIPTRYPDEDSIQVFDFNLSVNKLYRKTLQKIQTNDSDTLFRNRKFQAMFTKKDTVYGLLKDPRSENIPSELDYFGFYTATQKKVISKITIPPGLSKRPFHNTGRQGYVQDLDGDGVNEYIFSLWKSLDETTYVTIFDTYGKEISYKFFDDSINFKIGKIKAGISDVFDDINNDGYVDIIPIHGIGFKYNGQFSYFQFNSTKRKFEIKLLHNYPVKFNDELTSADSLSFWPDYNYTTHTFFLQYFNSRKDQDFIFTSIKSYAVNCDFLTPPLFQLEKSTVCLQGDSIKLSLLNKNNSSTYNLFLNNKMIYSNSDKVTYAIKDTGFIKIVENNSQGCFLKSDSLKINKNSIPSSPMLSRDTANYLVSNTAIGNTWYKDGVVITDTTQKIKPTVPGSYTVKATQNGCISTASNAYYYIVTDVINLSSDEFIKLAPNPFINQLNFDFIVKGYQRLNLEVFDIATGTKVASQPNLTAGTKITLGQLSAGTYVIKVTSADNKISYQFKMVKL